MKKIIDFFPGYVTQTTDPKKQDITIRHLLTMMSGYPSDQSIDTLEIEDSNFMKSIFELDLVEDPGELFAYSSIGTHLLSGILTKATGMNVQSFAERALCEPLQISIYHWDKDPQGIPLGGSGIYMTSRDMTRFGFLYLRNGLIDGDQIIRAAWIDESFQDYSGMNGTWDVIQDVGYGYLWWLGKINDYQIRFALGWAGQFVFVIPELDMVIVVTSEFPLSSDEADRQVTSILSLVANFILPAVK